MLLYYDSTVEFGCKFQVVLDNTVYRVVQDNHGLNLTILKL